jgi:hypothetical protein
MKTKKLKLSLGKIKIADLKLNSIFGGTVGNPAELTLTPECINSGEPACNTDLNSDLTSRIDLTCSIGDIASDDGNNLCDGK